MKLSDQERQKRTDQLGYILRSYKRFPESYLTYEDKYEMQIKLRIIQSFANNTLKKEFKVSEFLEKFKNTPNKTKAHIKNMILVSFQSLLQDKLIQKDITLHILGSKRKNKARLQKTLQIEIEYSRFLFYFMLQYFIKDYKRHM